MSNTFVMTGKLSLGGNDKRKSFEDFLTDSGCNIRTLRLNMKCGDDFFNLQIKSFMNDAKRKSDGTLNVDNSTIYTILDNDGKYESTSFKYKDKSKYEYKVANFRKIILVDGDERIECITPFDYAMAIYEIFKSDGYEDTVFTVRGDIEYTKYKNPKTGIENTYTNYNVNRIYVASPDAEEKAVANMELYITQDCIDDVDVLETGTFKVMGYVPQYLSKKKGEYGYYQLFEYPLNAEGDKIEKKYNVIKKLLLNNFEDNELCKMGFKVNLINRIKKVDFDVDTMITDDERDLLEFGIITKSELEAKYGQGNGGRETKIEIEGITRNYTTGAIPIPLTLGELMNDGEEKPSVNLNDELSSDADDMDVFASIEDDDFDMGF